VEEARSAVARFLWSLCALVLLGTTPSGAQSDDWTVYAGVVDRSGTPVTGLTAADFVVRENGVAREILRVSPATDSLRIAVLIDNSQEMRNDVIDLRQGLRGFVNEIDRRHEVMLMGFGGPPTVLVDYTRDLTRLEAGVSRLFARPGTGSYLLSAIIDASRAMRKRRDLRRVMVIITTQGPEFSEIGYQTVLEYVKDSGAPMHSYVLRREGISPTDAAAQEVELTLAVGTQMTGGRREELHSAMSMTGRLQSLATELNHQYQVVYARPKMLIPPKTIDVGVRRPDVVVRAPRVF
jgi:VWFA-related protein